MIKTIKRMLLSLSMFGMLVTPLALSAAVAAQATEVDRGLNCGTNLSVDIDGACPGGVNPDEGEGRLNSVLRLIINIFSLVVGVVAVIMIIVGGLKYIISGGDSGNVTGAKNTILYAIVGLVIVALAQFIVRFVLSRVSNASAV